MYITNPVNIFKIKILLTANLFFYLFILRDFTTYYLARDERFTEACWVPLLSDFDLELAFQR